jgi:sporadic carbohydrate cluster 2OG-Fe(II) oxygenase
LFLSEEETKLSKDFLQNGYIIRDVANIDALERIRDVITTLSVERLGIREKVNPSEFLNQTHRYLDVREINDFRVNIIQAINADPQMRVDYFRVAKPYLESIVGNELSMQLRLNLSIQFPDDSSSLLPVHSDTWSGDSPFEVVVWLPIVDCFRTKSMYILSPASTANLVRDFKKQAGRTSEDLFQAIAEDVTFVEVKYGQLLLFNQGLPHGNRVNEEAETRWSLNCRFKGVFTPYGDKKIGEFFEPITLRAASKIGMEYNFPVVE